ETGGAKSLDALLRRVPASGAAADVARLWLAEEALRQSRLDVAKRLLAAVTEPDEVPAARILEARLGFLTHREVDAAFAYEKAVEDGPIHDGLLLEAAQAFALLGFEPQAKVHLDRLASFGSRAPEAWYAAAESAIADHRPEDAQRCFLTAWKLGPLSRRDIAMLDGLSELRRRADVAAAMKLGSSEETLAVSDEAGKKLLPWSEKASLHTVGNRLEARVGDATSVSSLVVPGGACLAPPAAAEDTGARERAEEAKALERTAKLSAAPPSVGAFAQPMLRRDILETTVALARHHRHADVLALTANLSGRDEQVPTILVLLRARAFLRTNRAEEARRLLVELSDNPAFLRKNTPSTLVAVGDLFLSLGEFDRAVRMLQRAAAKWKPELVEDRIRQARVEQRLVGSYATYESPHFQILYPKDRERSFPVEVARILEAERERLKKWVPEVSEAPVKVHLLWYDEFKWTYGGGDVLGLFDGTIRIPLAGVTRFSPPVVALMTHELAHAMIADATHDRAPHWFQEGLAQHVEMRTYRPNHATEFHRDGILLALPVVDAVLNRFRDFELVEQAYEEADWMVAFVEAKGGPDAVHRLLSAYRDGLPTSDAVVRSLSLPIGEFQKRYTDWATQVAPKMQTAEVFHYDQRPLEDSIRTKKDASIQKGNVPDSLYRDAYNRGE
ncbi:MAG TPA: hypothetical protein VGR00_14420, partial [Thermoanaerobaculia bacterium]|nr:hypothetical protein [Thermoanaerobaculia bacterium]